MWKFIFSIAIFAAVIFQQSTATGKCNMLYLFILFLKTVSHYIIFLLGILPKSREKAPSFFRTNVVSCLLKHDAKKLNITFGIILHLSYRYYYVQTIDRITDQNKRTFIPIHFELPS